MVALSTLGTDLAGRPVLVWHYTTAPPRTGRPALKPRECRGSGRAAYEEAT